METPSSVTNSEFPVLSPFTFYFAALPRLGGGGSIRPTCRLLFFWLTYSFCQQNVFMKILKRIPNYTALIFAGYKKTTRLKSALNYYIHPLTTLLGRPVYQLVIYLASCVANSSKHADMVKRFSCCTDQTSKLNAKYFIQSLQRMVWKKKKTWVEVMWAKMPL